MATFFIGSPTDVSYHVGDTSEVQPAAVKNPQPSEMKKKAKKKIAAKREKTPPKNPEALTTKQIQAEIGADAAMWAWCKDAGIPTNKNGTFNLVAVTAWLLKTSAARQGLVYK